MHLPIINAKLKLDSKGRFTLPKEIQRFFEVIEINTLVGFASFGNEGGLTLSKTQDYQQMISSHLTNPLDPKSRLFAMAVCSTATTISIDKGAKVLVPKNLRDLLGFDDEIQLFSTGSWVEVWSYKTWREMAYPNALEAWTRLNEVQPTTSSPDELTP